MPEKTIVVNRRARHEFSIEDTFEAGIVLTGTEIKSIRANKVNLAEAFARIDRGEAWLVGAHIDNRGKAKLELGLGKGKQLHDRRRDIAERDAKRQLERDLAEATRR